MNKKNVCVCVCVNQNDGLAVGFITVSGKLNLLLLNMEYELGPFDGLRKKKAEKLSKDLDQSQQIKTTHDITDPQKPNAQSEVNEVKEVSHAGITVRLQSVIGIIHSSELLNDYAPNFITNDFTEPQHRL